MPIPLRRSRERSLYRLQPDPEQWWEVQSLIDIALDDGVQTWAGLAQAIGEAGLRCRDSKERGTPRNQMSDKASAAKTALAPNKLDTYETGRHTYEQQGPGHGIWVLPGGHRFTPRHDGDKRGSITYEVEVGVPEWRDSDFADRLRAVRTTWWPKGQPKAVGAGRAGRPEQSHPLSGLLARTGDREREGSRFEVLFHSGRWELRAQELATADRIRSGALPGPASRQQRPGAQLRGRRTDPPRRRPHRRRRAGAAHGSPQG